MATRFYFPETEAAAVSPAIQGTYLHTNTVRRRLRTTPDSSTLTETAYTPDAADHGVAGASHVRQYVSDQIGAQSVSGTFRLQIQGFEPNANCNQFVNLLIFVCSSDGSTIKETLFAQAASASELNTSLRNIAFTGTLSAADIEANDRIVIQIGCSGTPAGGGGVQGHNSTFRWGCNASSGDLPQNETETGTTFRAWIEFTNDFFPASLNQANFRGEYDASEEPSWIAALNTNFTYPTDSQFRMRFEVEETNSIDISPTFQLQYNRNGAGWNNVNASSSVVRSAASLVGNMTDGGAVNDRISGSAKAYQSGEYDEVDGLAQVISNLNNEHTEVLFNIVIRGADVSDGDTIQLRVVNSATPLTTYTNTPTITVAKVTDGASAATPGTFTAFNSSAPATSQSFSYTSPSGNNRLLVVTVSTRSGPVTGVTWDGTALQKAIGIPVGDVESSIWYLIAPGVKTGNVVVSLTSSGHAKCAAVTYTGAEQTYPIRERSSGPFESTTAPAMTFVSNAVDTCLDVITGPDNGTGATPTADAGQTERFISNVVGDCRGAVSTKAGAASVTMGWTVRSELWHQASVSIRPAPSFDFSGDPAITTNVQLASTRTPAKAGAGAINATSAPAATGARALSNDAAITTTVVVAATGVANRVGESDVAVSASLASTAVPARSGDAALLVNVETEATPEGSMGFPYFARRFFAPRYFAPTYFPSPHVAGEVQTGLSYFARRYFPASYFAPTYFPTPEAEALSGDAEITINATPAVTGAPARADAGVIELLVDLVTTNTPAREASAEISVPVSLQTSTEISRETDADVEATALVEAAGAKAASSDAAITVEVDPQAEGDQVSAGNAATSALVTVAATGTAARSVDAAVTANADLAATAQTAKAGDASASAIATPAAETAKNASSDPELTLDTDLNADGAVARSGDTDVNVVASPQATGAGTRAGAGAISADVDVEAAAQKNASADASITAEADTSATGDAISPGIAQTSVLVQVAATGVAARAGAAAVQAVISVAATGTKSVAGDGSINASTDVDAVSQAAKSGAGAIDLTADVTTAGIRAHAVAVALVVTAQTAASPGVSTRVQSVALVVLALLDVDAEFTSDFISRVYLRGNRSTRVQLAGYNDGGTVELSGRRETQVQLEGIKE